MKNGVNETMRSKFQRTMDLNVKMHTSIQFWLCIFILCFVLVGYRYFFVTPLIIALFLTLSLSPRFFTFTPISFYPLLTKWIDLKSLKN